MCVCFRFGGYSMKRDFQSLFLYVYKMLFPLSDNIKIVAHTRTHTRTHAHTHTHTHTHTHRDTINTITSMY